MNEELIIRYCSPTLAGLKTAGLFSCVYPSLSELRTEIRRLNRIFVPKGLRFIPLRISETRALLYLYRPKKLKADLSNETAAGLLQSCGYSSVCPERCITKLVERLRECDEFPHEIGLFLGYPPEDVKGFIDNRACNFKCCGQWKVYGDENEARRLFARYQKCTDIYTAQWNQGKPVERLAVAS